MQNEQRNECNSCTCHEGSVLQIQQSSCAVLTRRDGMAIDRRPLSKSSASSLGLLEESDLKNVPDLFLRRARGPCSKAPDLRRPLVPSARSAVLEACEHSLVMRGSALPSVSKPRDHVVTGILLNSPRSNSGADNRVSLVRSLLILGIFHLLRRSFEFAKSAEIRRAMILKGHRTSDRSLSTVPGRCKGFAGLTFVSKDSRASILLGILPMGCVWSTEHRGPYSALSKSLSGTLLER
ncbi:hypothetical protein KCU89_g100, partial [Aureobasidium melanogenum]